MGAEMNVVALVQARMGSTRFPGKVLEPIEGEPMIGLLLGRLADARLVTRIVLATTSSVGDDPLVKYVQTLGFDVFRGDEHDVLDRFHQAATRAAADVVVRITGDCPLVDPELVDDVIARFLDGQVDYASNVMPPTYPDGLDIEVFSMRALTSAWTHASEAPEREHVTPYMRRPGRFSVLNVENDCDHSSLRWTVDEPGDLAVIRNVFRTLGPRRRFGWREVLELQEERPGLFMTNQGIARNAGASLGTGQKLWMRAKRVIPGGSMLLSKRAEMFLPERWPAYFSRASGCRVWDLDGVEYVDMGPMGIGTNLLGYGHPEVDDAVRRTIDAGNMSTLNCPEEVYLAERLVALHPWADMVRLARSGGEANAVAIRIARAASGRHKVAFCGYHGWHDWYLSANLGDAHNLKGHLLPGLEPEGVPPGLKGTALPFRYNDYAALEQIANDPEVGVIKMEVSRTFEPSTGFLKQVRQLATERGIVLIFDECTSGFRQTFGGLHKAYDVEPDVAVFGKALGNGYAITAVVGRRAVMEAAQSTFISSTFWTERIGPTAGLETLRIMEHARSWEVVTEIGSRIGERWQSLGKEHGLTVKLNGLPALISFDLGTQDMLKYKTLITQEMLKAGFLATTSIYVSTAHTPDVVDRYFDAVSPVFGLIAECESGRDVDELLEGPVCHSGFRRLN
jgi:glutamate-1-semialdehyde 2,1-aminomutase